MASLAVLLATLREDLRRHGGDLTNPGFVALVAYRFGRWRDGLPPGVLRKALRVPYVAMHRRVRNRHRIELHYTVQLGRRVRLSGRGETVIGNRVVIGDDCVIGPGVTIGKTRDEATGWPVIGKRVKIGPGAIVVGDIRVGDDADIGPNSVVLADVPAGTQVTSRPAVVRETSGSGNPVGRRREPSDPRPVSNVTLLHRLQWRLQRTRIAPGAQLGRRLTVAPQGRVSIASGVRLGDDCVVGDGVTLGWRDPARVTASPTELGSRVVLETGSVVLAGVTVGDDVHVGPNAVVDSDVPAGVAVTCPPAGILRTQRPVSV